MDTVARDSITHQDHPHTQRVRMAVPRQPATPTLPGVRDGTRVTNALVRLMKSADPATEMTVAQMATAAINARELHVVAERAAVLAMRDLGMSWRDVAALLEMDHALLWKRYKAEDKARREARGEVVIDDDPDEPHGPPEPRDPSEK